ncbi:HAMP domain-containing sensor histidine kinase [Reichenbachiella sp. MALMAid0571]|uniref:sensor histidine kinase n=1 Tax=Reichenbachiella sp. MALMAid0571 TaxID=3143939 RepID=UPI0032E004DC
MASQSNNSTTLDLYSKRSNLKWVVLGVSVIIGLGSIWYTNILVEKIKQREKKLIEQFANALEFFANEEDTKTNYNFLFEEIIAANTTIPIVMTNEFGIPVEGGFRNIPRAKEAENSKLRNRILREELEEMKQQHEPRLITLINNETNEILGYQYIYYKNSTLLTQLKYYPIAQLSIIAIFGLIAFMAFNYSKTAEQNRVWVGLAKETAHQLGTPLSSLMAWVEYFKTDDDLKDKEIVAELEKDVERLEMITSRFSNIGSEPILKTTNLYEIVSETVDYLKKRVSTKVTFEVKSFPNKNISAEINEPLFKWVIENLCKNAVDAMGGVGHLSIKLLRANEGQAVIDITDTGKGIVKSKIGKVFQPGFTTKKRGWGLGLTLVKRIVENYHKGKIFVKSSDINKGTTFRILLRIK